MRDYILVLLAVFGIGVVAMPETSSTPILDTNTTQNISTLTLPEFAKFDEISLDTISDTAEISYKPIAAAKSYSSASVSSAPSLSVPTFTITNYSANIVEHPSYNDIYKTGRLVYAHNTKNLFGSLSTYSIGTVFNLVENGVFTTYQVSDIKVFEKNPENGKLQLNGSGNYMGTVVKNAFYHSVALMTCTGTSYGNGDASHRLVVFADQV